MAAHSRVNVRQGLHPPMVDTTRLRTRKGSGIYQTGRDRLAQILDVALEVLIEEGYQAMSLREVARRCKVQIGAITYYYKSRSDLLRDVLNRVLTPYSDSFEAIEQAPGLDPEEKLARLITLLLDDIKTKKTTHLFPHLWTLANHDRFVAKAVDRIYIVERLTFCSLIAEINPALNEEERETLAVFVSSAIAGSTMFVGYKKPWNGQLPLYRAIACRALLDLVKTVTPRDLQAYGWSRKDLKQNWTTPTMLSKAEFAALVASSGQETTNGHEQSRLPKPALRKTKRAGRSDIQRDSKSPAARKAAKRKP
jgi:AcrR family transcriptional regulator